MTDVNVLTDLRGLFGPTRDQGPRPTCLAFAASDTHAALRGSWTPLSCEYLFYAAQKRRNRAPTEGALLSATLEALATVGQPEEAGWPYLSSHALNLSTWVPPATVGPRFGRAGTATKYALDAVIAHLDQGQPMLLLTLLSQSFFSPTKGIVHPAAGETPDPMLGHAVIAAGHGTYKSDRMILVRNSWGTGWGDDGYAWLSETFLEPRLYGAARLMEDMDVSANSLAA